MLITRWLASLVSGIVPATVGASEAALALGAAGAVPRRLRTWAAGPTVRAAAPANEERNP